VTGNGGPSGTGKRPTSEPIFPAPVFIQELPSSAGRNVSSSVAGGTVVPAAGEKTKADGVNNVQGTVGNRTTSWPSIADKLKEDLAKQEKERDPQLSSSDAADGSNLMQGGNPYLASLRANTPDNASSKDNKDSVDVPVVTQQKEPVVLSTRSAKVAARKAEKEAKEMREREAREAAKELMKTTRENTKDTKDKDMKEALTDNEAKKSNPKAQEVNEEAQIAADEASNDMFLQSIINNGHMRHSKNTSAENVSNGTLGSVSPLTVSSTTTARPTSTMHLPVPTNQAQFHTLPALQALHLPSPTSTSAPTPTLASLLSTPPQVPTLSGPYKHAVFPLILSSINAPTGVWTYILQCSNAHTDLSVNPYGRLYLSTHSGVANTGCIFSELFDACLPPVDAVCLLFPNNEHHMQPLGYVQTLLGWPRPDSYYRRGYGLVQKADGSLSVQTHSVVVANSNNSHISNSSSVGMNGGGSNMLTENAMNGSNNKSHSTILQSLQQQHAQLQQQAQSQVQGLPQLSLQNPLSAFTASGEGQNPSGMGSATPPGLVEAPKTGGNAMAALQQMFPSVKMSFGVPKQAPKV
jgi:hypothetical protein